MGSYDFTINESTRFTIFEYINTIYKCNFDTLHHFKFVAQIPVNQVLKAKNKRLVDIFLLLYSVTINIFNCDAGLA